MANIGMGGYYQMSSNAGTYVAYGNNVFKKVNASMGQNFRIFGTATFTMKNLTV